MIIVFTGGTGGAKLVQGLQQVVPADELTVVVNTGDDVDWWGLHVSPDIDSVLYALGGLLSKDRGWGVDGDSFRCLDRMKQLGQPSWFNLGDLDLATHLTRTALLRAGKTLSEATAELATQLGIRARVLPMSDDRVSTMLDTAKGTLTFQEYFVRERHQVEVHAVRFEGAERARPAPGVIEAIEEAEAIIFAPSNPVTSIGPILAVPGIRNAMLQPGKGQKAPIIVVSPIVGDAAVSGPAGELMKIQGHASSLEGVLWLYVNLLPRHYWLVGDLADHHKAYDLLEAPIPIEWTHTIMRSAEDKRQLAEFVLTLCSGIRQLLNRRTVASN